MKIRNLRFANLNSLQGEWAIDFDHPSYQDSGIFLICGPTGAGKSTILDAISLALYGQTPRLNNVSKGSNEIMSRGQAACYTELTFTTGAGTYRCHWSQHRARKTVSGDLQTPRHEIVDHSSGAILETKIKEVGKKVVEVTGMDFDQFTRAMLLAQGEFNKFLLAGPNERAPLLEQITGTEIYSQISQEVHRLRGEEQHKLDLLEIQLAALQLMPEEEKTTLTAKLAELQQQAAADTQRLTAMQHKVNLLQLINSQQKTVDNLQAEHARAQTAWQQGGELRQRISLAEEAQRLFPFYLERQRAEQLTLACRERLAADRSSLSEVNRQVSAVESSCAECQIELDQWQQEQERLAPILKKVQALDVQLAELTAQQQEVSRKQALLQERLTSRQEQKKTLTTRKRQEEEHLQRLQDYRQSQATDEALVAQMSFFEDRLLDLEQRHRQLADLRHLVTSKEQGISSQAKQLEQQQASLQILEDKYAQLTASRSNRQTREKEGPSLSELYRSKEAAQRRVHLMNRLHDILSKEEEQLAVLQQLRHGQKVLQDKGKKLQHQRDFAEKLLKQYRLSLSDQEEIVRLKSAVAAYEDDRKRLEQGKPCPLCGATTHPFADRQLTATDEAVNTLEEKKKLVDNQQAHCHLLTLEQSKLTQEEIYLEERQAALTADTARLQELKKDLVEAIQGNDQVTLATIATQLQDGKEQLTLLEERLAKREELEARTRLEDAQLEALSGQRSATLQQVQQQQHQLRLDEAELKRERLHLSNLHHQCKELENRLTPALSILQPDMTQLAAPTSLLRQLQKRRDAWLANQTALSASQSSLQTLEQEHAELENDCHNLTERLTELLAEQQQHQSKINTRQEERQCLLGTRDPVQVQTEHNSRGALLRERHAQAEKQLIERKNRQAELVGKIASIEENLASTVETLSSSTRKLTDLLRESRLQNEETLLASNLVTNELEEARKAALQLTRSKEEAELRLKDGRQQLAAMMTEAGTLPEYAALCRDIDYLTQNITQVQNEIGALKSRLDSQQQTRKLHAQQAQAISQQRQELQYWQELHSLIGSADGKKFRNYAQGLTFELMIQHANRILVKMNDRYLLTRSPASPLDLYVIDNYQAGESRTAANLSGGESFLVSLALALGLASMAGQTIRVDSLFLDEGFGTLDEQTLEIAMDALASLQREGKLIGVISHVPLLRDRLALQLQVLRKPGGRSVLIGPGVQQII